MTLAAPGAVARPAGAAAAAAATEPIAPAAGCGAGCILDPPTEAPY